MNLRIHRIEPHTRVEGFGTRFCIWVQGCSIGCPGCANPETWDAAAGTILQVEQLIAQIRQTSEIEGVTLLGGEPFDQAAALAQVAYAVRKAGGSVICFTGYRYEKLLQSMRPGVMSLLGQTDLLIDGPYIETRRSFTRPWIGSDNQRYLFLTNCYSPAMLMREQNRLELRIAADGTIMVNGMGDMKILQKMLQNKGIYHHG